MINRFSGRGGRSRASPDTLCQKCLKRDKLLDYECTASTQERPYTSRPSRTQQLQNPDLVPALTSDTPNDLLRKDGIADEQLAKINGERERGRKRSQDDDYDMTGSRKRTRSISSYSSNSVSTISTNLSQDSRDLPNSDHDNYYTSQINEYAVPPPAPEPFRGQKRCRSLTESSSGSNASDRSRGLSLQRSSAEERVTRRKRKSRSPEQRGRRRSRSSTFADRDSRQSRSRSLSKGLRRRAKMRSPSPARPYGSRRARRSPSPAWSDEREPASSKHHYRQGYTQSQQDAKKYLPDEKMRGTDDRYRRRDSPDHNRRYRDRQDDNRSSRMKDVTNHNHRERSLSPYSKRIALTQAMNRGVA